MFNGIYKDNTAIQICLKKRELEVGDEIEDSTKMGSNVIMSKTSPITSDKGDVRRKMLIKIRGVDIIYD